MPRTLPSTQSDPRSLPELLQAFQITRWDCLIIGDGSGTKATKPGGWAAALIVRHDIRQRPLFWGLGNRASSNFCELSAYVAPLNQYVSEYGRPRFGAFRYAHIITDSQYTAQLINGEIRGKPRNAIVAGCFRAAKPFGVLVQAHWSGRDTLALNRFVDDLSRQARLLAEAYELETGVEERRGTVHEHNPLD